MFEGESLKKNRSVKASKLVIGIFVLVIASLFAMTFANPALAEDKLVTIKGEVVSLDNYAKTLTIRPIDPSQSSVIGIEGELTFSTDETANVTMCTMNKNFRDIRVGEKVEVTYHGRDGKLFADAIDIATPVFACYTEYE